MTRVIWNKIPKEVEDEIKYIQDYTKDTGREASITVCKKQHSKRLFTSNSAKGDSMSTATPTCDIIYGASKRIADVHTHPVDSNTIGILPSPADLTSTLQDTFTEQSPQISCVTNHVTPLTECYQPKKTPDKQKLWFYEQALNRSNKHEDHSFFIDNAHKDFEFKFYDPHTGRHIKNPKPNTIVKAAFGESAENLKKNLNELERPGFCLYIQSFTQPKNDKIQDECKRELKRKADDGWFGLDKLGL